MSDVGIKRLERLLIGQETIPGTAVPATTSWRGKGGMIEDLTQVEKIDEDVGILNGTNRTATKMKMGKLSLAQCELTFEQVWYILRMAFGSNCPSAPATDGTGTSKIWTVPIPTDTIPDPKSMTIQGGDNKEQEQLNYALATKWSVTGSWGDFVKHSSELSGQLVSLLSSGFTPSVPNPKVETANTISTKVYVDPVTGAYGATQVLGQLSNYKIDFEQMWKPKPSDDGTLYPTDFRYTDHKITGTLDLLHNAAASRASGAKLDWTSETPRMLRLDIVGSALQTAGTKYSRKHLIFDLPIKYTLAGALTEKDGYTMVPMTFQSAYDETVGNAGFITLVLDGISTLP